MIGNLTYHYTEVDDRKAYISFEDCPFRLVIEDGKYVGWYYSGGEE